MRRAVCLLGLVVLLAGATAWAEDTEPADLHVRGLVDVGSVVRWLEREADRIEAVQVLIAFDALTFAPPPGDHEFNRHEDLAGEFGQWLNAIDGWAWTSGRPLRVTSSLNPVSVEMGGDGGLPRIEGIVRHAWWEDARISRLEAPQRWMKRLLQRTDCLLQNTAKCSPRMLVYVTGRWAPERFLDAATWPLEQREWRRKLLPAGKGFDPEVVAPMLEKKGCRLYVVSPEVFFGEHGPYRELPVLPWAARPRLLPFDLPDAAEVLGVLARGELQLANPPMTEEMRRLIEELGVPADPRFAAPAPQRIRQGMLVPPHVSRGRFFGAPPLYVDRTGNRLLACTRIPSGYGAWPYVRAAAETNGRFVIYPRRAGSLLDVLSRDDVQLAELAPEPIDRRKYLADLEGDPALCLLCRVTSRLAKVTPFGDGGFGTGPGPAWSDITCARPIRLVKGAPLRAAPSHSDGWRGFPRAVRMARHVLDDVLPVYDAALGEVQAHLARFDAGEGKPASPRSVANLRRFRFDLAMSAFHLQAFATAILDLGQPRASWIGPQALWSRLRLLPVIRMSDCLEAYDGRTLKAAEEAIHAGWRPAEHPGYQGNLMGVPPEDPQFRSKRMTARVLLRLDPALRPRADLMIRAARDVMTHLARTPWGWGVYFTDAYTFSFDPP